MNSSFSCPPVALILFNRPERTRELLARIRDARPARLFLIADGPRTNHPTDGERCAAARAVVAEVDWPCQVERLYAERNLSCGIRIATGLTWVFEQVEEAIILEDDLLPEPSFFSFCAELLARYRTDERVYMISGHNPLGNWPCDGESYFFGVAGNSWGWATWRRAWQHFDFTLASIAETAESFQRLCAQVGRESVARHLQCTADELRRIVASGVAQPSVWDVQWIYIWAHLGGLAVIPTANLVANRGFDEEAIHTRNPKDIRGGLRTHPVAFPLVHPDREAGPHPTSRDFLWWERLSIRVGHVRNLALNHRLYRLMRQNPGRSIERFQGEQEEQFALFFHAADTAAMLRHLEALLPGDDEIIRLRGYFEGLANTQ